MNEERQNYTRSFTHMPTHTYIHTYIYQMHILRTCTYVQVVIVPLGRGKSSDAQVDGYVQQVVKCLEHAGVRYHVDRRCVSMSQHCARPMIRWSDGPMVAVQKSHVSS